MIISVPVSDWYGGIRIVGTEVKEPVYTGSFHGV